MRLTSFTDYGLRMLMRMAGAPEQGFSTADMAQEFGLSRHHLTKIVQKLAQAGYVTTRRGGGGGAMLARPATEIRLGAIVRLLEEGQPLVECFATKRRRLHHRRPVPAEGAAARGRGGVHGRPRPLDPGRHRAAPRPAAGGGVGLMQPSLTTPERQIALGLAVALAVLGLAMAAVARQGAMAVHGAMALALGLGLVFRLGGLLYDAAPAGPDRASRYDDGATRFGIWMTLAWAMIGMVAGVWVAALLYWPEATPPWPATSFGRLRPVHTTGIIFGFGGNALIATSFWVLQRTSRARLADALSPWVVLIGYNLFCAWAVTGYLMGTTQSKEYAEAEWYADLWLVWSG
jgi:Rrf2 family protein